ncbi:MAG: hypothetical protein MR630_07130 [Selenomonas sp.]|uniref:DNA-3-methyladenine glycosylase family protein n=1 Tax=Selenomonas sp. TaxID=2053611 RepID=UPI0025F17903|nr:hypothetical protein [Selenomonas sp.]MCI6232366.1 hypothetical protein [Selenomonas sp.]
MIAYGQKEMDYLAGKDPVMAKLIAHYGHFKRGVEQTVFSSLITHIVSQMLSNKVGAVLNGRLHALVGAYTPEGILRQTPAAIKGIGISRRKADYIVGLARGTADGRYDFDGLEGMTDAEVVAYLCQIPGVGKWTAEMIAEFTLGRLDIFSYGDAALRGGMVKAHGFKTLSKLRFERYRKKYTPYCSVASLYYYAVNDDDEAWL